ncbi:carboxymuconolactone decarboxylase family protein [uncultured Winogradskyella sp.]|uniref:carboxymuconolactone decarboxylase family protein n=1 Tax=uncultured Winogradskyella sp. TaxID=395353 RepID=UPI00262FFAC7|nr:carboxymuconolactone decarboxylase family protein [uncultured Winogradskyella sp.]
MERISYTDVPQEIFTNLMAIENYLDNSALDLHLLELVRLRVAQKNGCAYCVDMHHKILKKHNETDLRLSSLCVWEETNYFSEKECAVLKFTDVLTRLERQPISDSVFKPLLEHFTKAEIAQLTLAISQINTWTRLMKTFGFAPGKFRVKNN